MEDSEKEGIGWYVSDTHCLRAIGYLSAKLVEDGYLSQDFNLPVLLEMWGEALEATMDVTEPSPIGPDLELMPSILDEGRIRAIACEEVANGLATLREHVANTPQRTDGNLNARDFYMSLELAEKDIRP